MIKELLIALAILLYGLITGVFVTIWVEHSNENMKTKEKILSFASCISWPVSFPCYAAYMIILDIYDSIKRKPKK